MYASKNRAGDDSQMPWKPVPVPLQRHREGRRRLRNPQTQGHMGTTSVIIGYPLLQNALQMGGCQGNHEIQTLAPKRTECPLTDRIGSGSLGWRFRHPQAQVAYALVESL